MEPTRLNFPTIVAKTVVVHTVTYFVVGVLAFTLLDYTTRFAAPLASSLMTLLSAKSNQADAIGHRPNHVTVEHSMPMKGREHGDAR
jgi:hypothetical protein